MKNNFNSSLMQKSVLSILAIIIVSRFVAVRTQKIQIDPIFSNFAQSDSGGLQSSQFIEFSSAGSQPSSDISFASANFPEFSEFSEVASASQQSSPRSSTVELAPKYGGPPSSDLAPGSPSDDLAPGPPSDDLAPDGFAIVEVFAHRLLQLLETSPAIKVPISTIIPNVYEAVYEVGVVILHRTGIDDTSLADKIAREAERVGMVSLDLYISTLCHLTAKSLYFQKYLTFKHLIDGPEEVLDYVEAYADQNGADEVLSAMLAVSNGIYNFAQSKGLINVDSVEAAFRIFLEYFDGLEDGTLV